MSYGILRVSKIKLNAITKAFQQHHQREASFYRSNPDIDISRLEEDISLVRSRHFKNAISAQLEKHGITKTPRKDAIGLIDGVMTASPEFFEGKDKQSIINFFKGALPLIQKEFGPLISATIHFDEKTPHLHFAAVPIKETSKGYKLCAKEVLGGRQEFIARQDRFHDSYFKRFGLARGESAKETDREHIEQNRYKAQQAHKELLEIRKATQEQKAIYQDLLIENTNALEKLQELRELTKGIEGYKKAKQALEGDIKALEGICYNMIENLTKMAQSYDIVHRTLEIAIMRGDTTNEQIERLQQALNDSYEAQQALDELGYEDIER